jgi:hypothetical protein
MPRKQQQQEQISLISSFSSFTGSLVIGTLKDFLMPIFNWSPCTLNDKNKTKQRLDKNKKQKNIIHHFRHLVIDWNSTRAIFTPEILKKNITQVNLIKNFFS